MNYGEIILNDCANGIGLRVSLFVSGCTLHCKGCFQPETQNFNYGLPYTEETENFILSELSKDYYHGISILGGEPFEPSNQKELVNLVTRIKKELPQKTIWMYTGYTYENDLCSSGHRYTEYTDTILDNINILVDGKFIADKRDLRLKFRGSSNQRIIDMDNTRKTGTIVLAEF